MRRWAPTFLVAAVSFLTGGWLLQRAAPPAELIGDATLFEEVLSHVEANFVDSLGDDQLFRKATDGLLDQLDDPYTVLLTGQDLRELTETTTGNYAGLGIQIDVRDGWITVVAPLPESPAERLGIQTGDQIVEVDGKPTEGWSSDRAVNTLRGPLGSKVRVVIRRPGITELIPFEVERAEIHIRSVQAPIDLGNGTALVALNPVSETSAAELKREIEALRTKGLKSLILDLRGNPGGLLEQGVEVSDLFLDQGQEVVATRGRTRGATRTFNDRRPQAWPDLPIVVLVDEGSASAAEIIAGALQDHDRAVVVGTPTFGKGSVQTLFPLREGAMLKLTTARWYTPIGRSIQREAESAEDQIAQVMREATGRPDTGAVPADTSGRPRFKTDSGREVRGGGGIVPDLIVRRDTLTQTERAFVEALGSDFAKYRDVLTTYALELKQRGAVTQEAFTVTPDMRAEVRRRLVAKGIQVDDATFTGAGRFVEEQISYEVARYVFGREAEFRRRVGDDKQVAKAIELLRQAQTPKGLMELTMSTAARRCGEGC
jgi:carboxyl-terminal processing protease